MAVFLLKTEHGSALRCRRPAPAIFGDVPCPSPFADWIEQLFNEGDHRRLRRRQLLPERPDTRGQMAVFLVKTFAPVAPPVPTPTPIPPTLTPTNTLTPTSDHADAIRRRSRRPFRRTRSRRRCRHRRRP